jgi:Arc/MetJ-type ribon-helix-helix transcriptional regulator
MTNFERDPIIELADLRSENEVLRAGVRRWSQECMELKEEVKRLRALLQVSLERAMYEGEG